MEKSSHFYKVLLVDDEEDVRQSIARKLNWEELGFRLAGEASNGAEALELAERLEPDIVMTDIKMPFMDGLELTRRLKRLLPGVRVAIFSGFDEFEYARKAISQQVEEYILKPVDADELSGVFRRLRETLDAEIAERRNYERLRQFHEQSLPIMRQQILSELLEGNIPPGQIDSELTGYDVPVEAAAYCVASIRYRPLEGDGDLRLLGLSLRQLVGDLLEDAGCHIIQKSGHLAILFLMEEGGIDRITELLGRLFPAAKKLLGLQLSIGIGEIRRSPGEIPLSYAESVRALDYQILMEPGQSIFISDIEPGSLASVALEPAYIDRLLREIKVGGEESLREAADTLTAHIRDSGTDVQQYQIFKLRLCTELLWLIQTYHLDPQESGQQSLLPGGGILGAADLDHLSRWLGDFCENLRNLARRERKDSVRMLIDRAKDCLRESFADSELSLESVSEALDVSAAYLSTMFKKETGQGFVSYLTDLRMEQALERLSTTDEKTYQIAEAIGYSDPNYFSYVFKRKFGVSPSKYRTDRLKGDEAQPVPEP